MKKIICVLLAIILGVAVIGCKEDNSPKKTYTATAVSLIEHMYKDSGKYSVVNYNVVDDFGAVADGVTDDTDAINKALTQAMLDGGGAIYFPEGKYLVSDMLMIPDNVFLIGEWNNPKNNTPAEKGTTILADNSQIFLQDPIFYMSSNTGIKNMTIMYKEQSISTPIEYYAAIDIGTGNTFTMENLTVLGAFGGINLGPKGNEIFYVHNVYISALKYGVYNSGTSDIGRFQNVYISPVFWANNAISSFSDKDKEDIKNYCKQNTTGIEFGYNDWGMSYDLNIEYCKTGLQFNDYITPDGVSFPMNGTFTNTVLKDCDTGIYFEQTKLNGISFTNLDISTSDVATSAIDTSEIFYGTCQFENTTISGKYSYPVRNNGLSQCSTSGSLVFLNANIKEYDSENNYAVTMNGGAISLQNSSISSNKKHINITTPKIQSLTVLGCSFDGEKDFVIPNGAKELCNIDDTETAIKATNFETVEIPQVPTPKSGNIYNVDDFGASTSADDNTKFFQAALDEAGKTGGVVYVPAGYYKLRGNITVPSGVELNGCCSLQNRGVESGGTMLWAYSGQGDEEGTPFITLEASAGVKNFSVYYPNQATEDAGTIEYPWTIQGTGNNCYAIRVSLINSYNGIDFGTYESKGAYVDFVTGSPIRRGIFLGNNSGDSWISNCLFNPNYAYFGSRDTGEKEYRLYYCDAYIFGYNENLTSFANFVFQSKNGFMFMTQDGKGTKGRMIMPAVDGSECCLRIYDLDDLEIVACQFTAMDSVNMKCNVRTEKTFDGKVTINNGAIWGPTNYPFYIDGGKVMVNMVNLCTGAGKAGVYISNGSIDLYSVTMHNPVVVATQDAESINIEGCFVRPFKQEIKFSNDSKECLFSLKNNIWA